MVCLEQDDETACRYKKKSQIQCSTQSLFAMKIIMLKYLRVEATKILMMAEEVGMMRDVLILLRVVTRVKVPVIIVYTSQVIDFFIV